MLLVLLDDVLLVGVELEDLFVRAARQEDVLLVLCWMELDAEGRALVGIAPYDFTSFGVPQLHHPIEACTQEPSAIVGEADVPHCFLVALVGSDALPVGHDVPNLHGAVMAGTQQ